ncbi:MAG: 2Fe-2S iron-sulfur cluster-binding protein [Syntrophobacteraceae bacterium]|jgi:sarcosine oxidase subunit alpha|nr:2Fe-2S iron-sulfur cluster-binding protein [Syntrophobacteraceae bacterium]
MSRLLHLGTLKIDPGAPRTLRYGGRTYEGFEGDTVATALYAGGVRVFSRSLKYHRPRGLYSLDGESGNTLMAADGVPNVMAELTPVRNGMRVEPQNVKGTPEWDLMGFMDRLSWALPAGFYYRMFHKPASLWPKVIPVLRKTAGLGTMKPDFRMVGRFDEVYLKTDVCVIGGGPAGMSAALAASEQGLRVVLLELRPWLGGFFDYRERAYSDGVTLHERGADLALQSESHPNLRVLKHTPVVSVYPTGQVTAFQRGGESFPFDERYVEIQARSIVVATGCNERPLVFENNERPGVMQPTCAHRLARTWGILPGRRAAFSVGSDLGIEAALDLADLGMEIACVADVREDGQDPELVAELTARSIPLMRGWVAVKAHGRGRVKAVSLSPVNGTRQKKLDCDLLAASAGFTPATGPLSLAGAKLSHDPWTGFFLPVELPPGAHGAGRLLGLQDPRAIELSGREAGLRAAGDCGRDVAEALRSVAEEKASRPGPSRNSKLVLGPVKGSKSFLCFDEDTTIRNVNQAMAAGFDVPELIKRFTAAGTGPSQGSVPGHNLALYVAQTHESPDPDPRPTTVRPPLHPIRLGTYAGTGHGMSKQTPVHALQVAAGGRMEKVGVWSRARRFSDDKTARDEIINVRQNVGILDGSTLGKFRIHGPDALKALQRVYVGDMSRIREGRIKYSAMCNEDGCLLDDGVVVKRGENDYYFTSSTARAGSTIEWLRYHTRYDDWDYHLVNLTDAFGVINVSGPNARKVLQKVTSFDLSNERFPFAACREFEIGGSIPVRAMRLGFVGELSFELHVPSSLMEAAWRLVEEAGRDFGMKNFGLEAQNVLRMEKGHVIIGSESEQRTTLHDLGLGFLWHRDKADARAVGAAALIHTEHQKDRLKLVGFKMRSPSDSPPKDGCIIVDGRIRGYVCTARRSSTLGEVVGMALVDEPLAAIGGKLSIFEDECGGRLLEAVVAPMPFYDPEGSRMKM